MCEKPQTSTKVSVEAWVTFNEPANLGLVTSAPWSSFMSIKQLCFLNSH